MDIKDLKLVKGALEKGKPATMTFFDDVDWWSCDRFVEELEYIENYVQPSEIRILINSAGGNVVEGMKVFAKILDCKIPTITQVAGIAASMGSIIWAAGQKLYMADYSIVMIHNPWMGADMNDPNNQQIIEAFKKQLTTVYCKRFGFSEDKVKEIMDGKEGCDGTWLSAEMAVEQGFIPVDHVIETPQTVKNRIAASIKGLTDKMAIQAIMSLANQENYQPEPKSAISDKEPKGKDIINSQIKKNMEELKVVASQLGIQGEVSLDKVTASIIQLKELEAKYQKSNEELETVKNELNNLKIQHEAEKSNSANLQKSIDTLNAELKVYKDKEAEEKKNAINALVDGAIAEGKISAEAKDSWVAMAEQNFDMVKASLDGIKAVAPISAQIAGAPENKKEAKEGQLTEEEKIKAKVDELVPDFKFKTIEDLG